MRWWSPRIWKAVKWLSMQHVTSCEHATTESKRWRVRHASCAAERRRLRRESHSACSRLAAAGAYHASRGDVLQELLVEHVLPIVQDVAEHVSLHDRTEELSDRVVIRMALVEVRLLRSEREEQQTLWVEGLGAQRRRERQRSRLGLATADTCASSSSGEKVYG